MASAFGPVLQQALDASLEHLAELDHKSVSATATLEELRERLRKPLQQEGLAAETVIEDLVRDAKDGLLGSAGGRFFAWVIGGAVPAALAADWLTSAWDQNAGMYAVSPSAAVVEEVAGEWLKDLLGLPPTASFAFVTGCQMAHATCLAAARNSLLTAGGWDVERKGLFGAPPIRILTSTVRHGSFLRAVRLLGLGEDIVEELPADDQDRLLPQALEAALAKPIPTMVVLQAGDINIGAFDDFTTLIPIAKRHNAWVHVDGAFGLWAAASPTHRHLLAGVAAADSWATDGHKWLNVPYDSGYAFVADRTAHMAAMSFRAPYLVETGDAREEVDWNPEFSRRARGFATYAAIRQLGRNGVAEMIDRCCECAKAIANGIGALPGAELLWEPQTNQGLVRFLSPTGDHDRRTDEVIAGILKNGGAYFGGTTWRGKRAMRISVCNWQTSQAHVERAIETVREVLLGR